MEIEIIFEDESELAEYEAINRGCRNDVIIKIDDKKYKLNVIHIIRLQQDFMSDIETIGFYISEPLTIIVNDMGKESIKKTIVNLYERKYFDIYDRNGFWITIK